jgi:hypothetical protein
VTQKEKPTVVTRDALVRTLSYIHGPLIREADEWRPLAAYILELMRQARDGHLIPDKPGGEP